MSRNETLQITGRDLAGNPSVVREIPITWTDPQGSGFMVGARARDVTFAAAQTALGPLQGSRTFYPGSLPSKWAIPADPAGGKLPAGIVYHNSFTTIDGNIESYCDSAPAGTLTRIIWLHEVENGKRTPAQYQDQMGQVRDRIRAVGNPAIQVGMTSAGSQYNDGDVAPGGGWIVPGLDFYGVDLYRPNLALMQPLRTFRRFQNWHNVVPAGARFMFCEYGVGALDIPDDPQLINSKRVQLFQNDIPYLQTLPNFDGLLYWYTESQDAGDHDYRFTDLASKSAFQGLPRRVA